MTGPVDNIISIQCDPDHNRNMLQFTTLHISIAVRQRVEGASGPFKVLIRTNLNQARRIRQQKIDLVEKNQSYSTDYYDIQARYDAKTDRYLADIFLNDVGYFEYKVRVESTQKRKPWVRWSDGANVGITVTPFDYARNNSIYCAFIRQFDDNKTKTSLVDEEMEKTIKDLEDKGAYVLPPGGNFEKFTESLPFIIEELGMKIIHLLPINPIPTSYGRMGMYGSPYATTDYFGIDHTYGTFSRYKTIEDQLIDLTSTIHGLGAKVFLDMVINHTGWASTILFKHRQWITVGHDRKIVSPGAWGVIWGDLVELDYKHRDLWTYMADVFLAWCRRGIDGFRLDAGYMVPIEVWQYIISKVRQEFPNTLFLLEGLGGPWETTEKLLTEGQINWAYSELFQNYSRDQIDHYLGYAQYVSNQKGVMVHYAETHDNDRLAKKGKIYTLMRLYLCAFTSFTGAWGFTNGVEWLATEKIDVHRNTGLNWGSDENLVDEISTINSIMAENPAFWTTGNIETFQAGSGEVYAFTRHDDDKTNIIIGLINLNTEHPMDASLNWEQNALEKIRPVNLTETQLHNLLDETMITCTGEQFQTIHLEPGQCKLFRMEKSNIPAEPISPPYYQVEYERISLIYQILLNRFAPHEVGQIDQNKLLTQITDIRKFIALVNSVKLDFLIKNNIADALDNIDDETVNRYSAVWTFRESTKKFIISGDQWLVVHTFVPCTAYLRTEKGSICCDSIPSNDELGHLTCFPPRGENKKAKLQFNWKIVRNKKILRQWQDEQYPILSLPSGRRMPKTRNIFPLTLEKTDLNKLHSTVLMTNGIGGVCQCPAVPGILNSKYDTLLAITPAPDHPAGRLALIKTVKETVQIGQKYFDLDESFFTSFTRYPHPTWEFIYDDGQYRLIIERMIIMPSDENRLLIRYRLKEANTLVNLISKCYIECRDTHAQVHASQDELMRDWLEQSTRTIHEPTGVIFTPNPDLEVQLVARNGDFIEQPHWIYDLDFPLDAHRGLDAKGDAFAPGVFTFELQKGNTGVLSITATKIHTEPTDQFSVSIVEKAEAKRTKELLSNIPHDRARRDPFVRTLADALDQFIVNIESKGWHIIAGYPWLPVQVRDMLYISSGLLAAGRTDVARETILLAAGTEKNGMLKDIIDPSVTSRTSTEASLHLFLSSLNYIYHTDDHQFLDSPVDNDRTLRDVLINIFKAFRDGNGRGPTLEPTTGMLYNPANFSWMNTTYPTATPRQGYPIEIQALWYQALLALAQMHHPIADEVLQVTKKIKDSFMTLFWNDKRQYLADVLLADRRTKITLATIDTALRFNQLEAILAGLVPNEQARQIVNIVSRRLVIPAGMRSLSEDPLAIPLRILDDRGMFLTDPRMPYQGQCVGNETQRRIAYHNGTAWSAAYPIFIEARAHAYGLTEAAIKESLAYFEPINTQLTESSIGSIAEMFDGNYPHFARGCHANAIAVAEALRVYMKLRYKIVSAKHESSPEAMTSGHIQS